MLQFHAPILTVLSFYYIDPLRPASEIRPTTHYYPITLIYFMCIPANIQLDFDDGVRILSGDIDRIPKDGETV
jgi:hypothetical protein